MTSLNSKQDKLGLHAMQSRYLYGSDKFYYNRYVLDKGTNNEDKINRLIKMFYLYQNDDAVKDLEIITNYNSNDYANGFIAGHSHAVKYVDPVNQYVELVNPWDDADVIRFSFDYLYDKDLTITSHSGVDKNDIKNLIAEHQTEIDKLPKYTYSS